MTESFWKKLIFNAHPDRGGSEELVRKIITDRDKWRASIQYERRPCLYLNCRRLFKPQNCNPKQKYCSCSCANKDKKTYKQKKLTGGHC